ncbi:hypothetical protein ACFV2Q_27740 [Streptomyces sp. NPDC059650]|uniref:hypothetical protein n=1 Tax=Streptomyces sp. NPDC059650 TaxID=3346896 RepID=UPI00368151BE
MNQPMNSAQKRAYNQQLHAARRQQEAAGRPGGLAELWWDQARRIAREQAEHGDGGAAWNDLALTLSNFCSRYSK